MVASRGGCETLGVERLFETEDAPRGRTSVPPSDQPLAVRMRPATLSEFIGQEHLLGEGSALRTALGAVFIALLANFMLLRDTTFGMRTFVTGLIVVVATSAFHLLRSRGTAT